MPILIGHLNDCRIDDLYRSFGVPILKGRLTAGCTGGYSNLAPSEQSTVHIELLRSLVLRKYTVVWIHLYSSTGPWFTATHPPSLSAKSQPYGILMTTLFWASCDLILTSSSSPRFSGARFFVYPDPKGSEENQFTPLGDGVNKLIFKRRKTVIKSGVQGLWIKIQNDHSPY
jgi:hypothetical protein